MTIPEIIKQAHKNAVRREFYRCRDCGGNGSNNKENETDNYCSCSQCNGTGKTTKLNVYHDIKTELEEFIKSAPCNTFNKDSEQSEIADMILILLAYCGEMKIDIESAVIEKMKYNATREYKHGKKY